MAPIIPKRPNNPSRSSSNISQSSSFRSLFSQPNKPLSNNTDINVNDDEPIKVDNRILPVEDFPPQSERRRSSVPDIETEHQVPDSENLTNDGILVPRTKQLPQNHQRTSTLTNSTSTPNSRSNSINHKRSHSLRRKPVPSLLLNTTISNENQALPSDHPFASSKTRSQHSKNDSASSSVKSVPSGRNTPNLGSHPTASAPDRGMGRTPPPPARRGVNSPKENEGNGLVIKKKSNRPDTAGTFGGRRSVDESRPTTAAEGSQGQLSRLGSVSKEDALNARMISLSLDRPLPPTPTENEHLPMQNAASSSSSRGNITTSPLRSSVDPKTSTRSVDFFDILRNAPPRRSTIQAQAQAQARPSASVSGSVPMSNSSSSGIKYRSKVFSRDSGERVKKASSPSSKENSDEEEFNVDRLPSKKNLWEAGTCFLKDENGDLKCFGDLFPKYPNGSSLDDHQYSATGKGKSKDLTNELGTASATMEKSATYSGPESINGDKDPKVYKTVVFFIRHFWCGQCQDYTFASLSLLDPEVLEKAGIRVVIISNGSWKIIKAYKKLFNCPFPIYVDGPRRLYQLMGMTKMTNDFGPLFKGRAAYHQRAVPGQLLHGLGNAFFRMPLANPGTLTQLGGEFILTPGWNCDFAHRMTTTSDHMEAPEVLRLAGCPNPTKSDVTGLELADSQKAELVRLENEMKEWQENRTSELERIQKKKAARRGVAYNPSRSNSEFMSNLDGVQDASETSPGDDVIEALQPPFELKSVLSGAEAADPSVIDAKLETLLQERELREKEKLAASTLMLARGRGDLEVHLESGVKA